MRMPPNEGAETVTVATRAFSYDRGAVGAAAAREIAVEAPVELAFGGVPFAVMMATPTNLEDFAVGFALTEGIIEGIDEIRGVEATVDAAAARVNVTLTGERMREHLARKRAMSGRTGCGLCGIEDLDHLPTTRRRVAAARPIAPSAIGAALAALETAQPLNALTRAVHAAAWCGPDGAIRALREDVGRHNALDKLIGALLRARADPEDGFVLITSRCSFEMVAKTAAFGAGTLVSVSAPTSLALARAEECGIALVAIARPDRASSFLGEVAGRDHGAAA
jgi:FdhD protein